jgi:acyl carrier protein
VPQDTIEQRISRVVAKALGKDESLIKPETRFKEDLGADDFDLDWVLVDLEGEFDLEISEEEEAGIKTVQDFITLLKSKVPSL